MFLRITTGLLIVFVSVSVFADCEAQFREASVRLIEKALANGWVAIGDTTLAEYKEKVAQSAVLIVCPEKFSLTFDGRDTASYHFEYAPRPAYIMINRRLWESIAVDLQEMISLHETLGANKFSDNNYELTTRFKIMSKEPFVPNSPLSAPLIRAESGTVTGVGGGGDVVDLEFRYIYYVVFRDYLNTIEVSEAQKFEFLRVYLEIPIDIYIHDRINELARIKFNRDRADIKIGVGLNSLTHQEGVTDFLSTLYVAVKIKIESLSSASYWK